MKNILTEAAMHRAEMELAETFSGILSVVMSNVLQERADLMEGVSIEFFPSGVVFDY